MAALVDDLATRAGEPIIDDYGDKLLRDHSWRTGGAVYLTSIGIDPYKVNLLARWKSPMNTHYAKLAPLKSIPSEFKAARLARASASLSAAKYSSSASSKLDLRAVIDDKAVAVIHLDFGEVLVAQLKIVVHQIVGIEQVGHDCVGLIRCQRPRSTKRH